MTIRACVPLTGALMLLAMGATIARAELVNLYFTDSGSENRDIDLSTHDGQSICRLMAYVAGPEHEPPDRKYQVSVYLWREHIEVGKRPPLSQLIVHLKNEGRGQATPKFSKETRPTPINSIEYVYSVASDCYSGNNCRTPIRVQIDVKPHCD